ncbi:hypothetical protein P3S67_030266 [Capsicum chacoense]
MDNQHKLLPNQYKLPSSLFTCSQLKHLFLQQCLIHPPPLFKGFDKLISLELIEVTISSELLVSLISHSPLLDHLVLDCNEVSHHIEISAPKLRSFFFAGNIDFLHLKNVPLLSKVSYEPVQFSIDAEHDLAKIFESIPALENLCWNHGCLQELLKNKLRMKRKKQQTKKKEKTKMMDRKKKKKKQTKKMWSLTSLISSTITFV